MDYRQILRTYWGYDDFRGIQREIIESIGMGKDTLGLMPTGGGKSVTFQVPALAKKGVCIVITPLIALMNDQVHNLRKRGINAAFVNSNMSRDAIVQTLENCIFGGTKILYVSPERLSSELFLKKLSHMTVSLITVDEAHCISQWGYDFRPSYLQISEIRKRLPGIPVLALTATATPQVIDDIQERLGFAEKNVFRMSFERRNLTYMVKDVADKQIELIHLLSSTDGCAIVYVRSRRRAKEISDILSKNGVNSTFYHAGLDSTVRDERQKQWKDGSVRVIVATNAFGMGIDKPDVRLVVHIDCPDSPEAYFQEAGRAGRDGLPSYAILLYNANDKHKLERRINETFPEKDYIRLVYEHLAYFYQIGIGSGYGATFEFNIDKFCRAFKHFPIQVDSALKILTRSGYILYDYDRENRTRLRFLLGRDDLYRLNLLSDNETKVITALLRNYSGLFTDYKFIDESYIAQQAGMERPQVYLILKNLSARHIIHFIPRKNIPMITYKQRREDMEMIIIPPSVYEKRKEQYIRRIQEMISYATNNCICRSRQLLRYFGETHSTDCGQCDVCQDNDIEQSDKIFITAKENILAILNDKKLHPVYELHKISLPREYIDYALKWLLAEEEVVISDGMLHIIK